MKVYGPYTRADGRKHIIYYDFNNIRRTQSYPRYLMEQKLNRKLNSSEHIDHINGDHTDDRIENLQILSQKENNQKSMIETNREAKYHDFICPICSKKSRILLRNYKRNQITKGHSGPYCSKSCTGKATHIK